MNRFRIFISAALVALMLGSALTAIAVHPVSADGLDPSALQDLGPAPELTNDTWINADKPLRLADLRGKVVLIDFWTFDCINCQHTLPYLTQAYAKYKDQGVEFIGDHFPEFSFEHDIDNVRQAVKDDNIQYPVAIDNDGVTWNAYEMHAWPAIIIVDKAGRMRFRQIGEGNYDRITAALDALIAEPAPDGVDMNTYKMSTNPLVTQDLGIAPELHNTTWINVDQPLHLADLHSKVVLLEFWTFECINCIHTLPAMNGFYDKYHDKGLVIIGDHFPEFSYEADVDNVRNAVKEDGIKYAVAIDNDGATWNAYSQRYWPTMVLIDKRGHIRYRAIGEHDYSVTDQAIQALLAE